MSSREGFIISDEHILIRVDGSPNLGMGHITRCLALAYSFKERDIQPLFVCKHLDSRVLQRISDAGYVQFPLPPDIALQDDAQILNDLGSKHDACAVVIDLCNTETTSQIDVYTDYLHNLANKWRTVIIDDLTRVTFPNSIVVNPNAGVDINEYDRRYYPLLLTGPRYSLIHPAFRNISSLRSPAQWPIRNVVVSLGGGTTGHDTLFTILQGIKDTIGLLTDVYVVTGLDRGDLLKDSENLVEFFRKCSFLMNIPNLANIFAKADLAIVSGGVTKYEAAAAGTPAIIVAQVEHQIAWSYAFEKTGAAIYAGFAPELTPLAIYNSCQLLNNDANRFHSMAEKAPKLVDGYGGARVVEATLAALSE